MTDGGGGGGGANRGGASGRVGSASSAATSAIACSNVRSISARSSPIDDGGKRCPRAHMPPTSSTSAAQLWQYRAVPICAHSFGITGIEVER
jgi:hypothetical protein